MKKIIYTTFNLFILTLVLNSCEVDAVDPVFDEPPALRIRKDIQELKTILLSEPQGFSGIYFPNNSVVGGINFHMQFTEDLRVKMTSDFKEDTALTDSRYDIIAGTNAAELIFTTGSRHITDLVQDGAQFFNTFFGANSFQYVGEENGVITFKEIRSDGIFKMSPSGFTDFDTESVASANTTYANRQEFISTPLATAFPFLSMEKDGEIQGYDLNYNQFNIYALPSGFDSNDSPVEEKFGVAFTETGIIISPAVEFNGIQFEEFTLDTSSGFEYISQVEGATAKIGYSNSPPTPLDIYGYDSENEAAVLNMDEPYKHSGPYNTFFESFSNDIFFNSSLPGLQITNVIFWELNTGGISFIDIRTTYGNVFYDISFDFDETTGIVKFELTGVTNAPSFFTDAIQPLLDILIGSEAGYYTVNSGNYFNFPNKTFGLINIDDPRMKIDFWTF
ncbi:DUF4302 domain-containing protein [Flavivirga amylovorans]|uniref:DUF4302 domain-containing protein n=1 Tax=Flavivirga amylovorans TaxID=870486 RepID=A0ABT8WVW7_9FLAO|nr:DUF4302 domain-containing protein [Flavivirga amylovorans]MDO5985798.1 DUF4302 domain-containing protein [Flavivirga amylovorans]